MSYRALLKRYNLWRRELNSSTNEMTVWKGLRPAIPFLRGNVTGAVDTTGAAASYNYCNTVLLHWVTNAFAAWRGSIRYKMLLQNQVVQRTGTDLTTDGSLYVQRRNFNDSLYFNSKSAFTGYTSSDSAAESAVIDGQGLNFLSPICGAKGMLYANTKINPTAEFEIPYYSPIRFSPAKQANLTTATANSTNWEFYLTSTASDVSYVDFHVATGEDYQTYFWTGLPRMYYELSPPAA